MILYVSCVLLIGLREVSEHDEGITNTVLVAGI